VSRATIQADTKSDSSLRLTQLLNSIQ